MQFAQCMVLRYPGMRDEKQEELQKWALNEFIRLSNEDASVVKMKIAYEEEYCLPNFT